MVDTRSLLELRQNPLFRLIKISDVSDIPQPLPPIVDIDIMPHIVFRWSAWRDYPLQHLVSPSEIDESEYDWPLETWKRMYPALQTATLLLERAKPLMVRIIRCPIIPRVDGAGEILDPSWCPGQDDYDAYERELSHIANELRILHFPKDDPHMPIACTTYCKNVDYLRNRSLPPVVIHMGFAADFIEEISGVGWTQASLTAKANTSLLLAVTILHELGHVMWYRRCQLEAMRHPLIHWRQHMNRNEPLVFPEQQSELGRAVSKFVIGVELTTPFTLRLTSSDIRQGRTEPLYGHVIDGTQGIYAVIFDENDQQVDARLIAMETVFSFFNELTYHHQVNTLYLLPNQLRSLNHNHSFLQVNGIPSEVHGQRLLRRALGYPGLQDDVEQ